jgi:hypothetical protein
MDLDSCGVQGCDILLSSQQPLCPAHDLKYVYDKNVCSEIATHESTGILRCLIRIINKVISHMKTGREIVQEIPIIINAMANTSLTVTLLPLASITAAQHHTHTRAQVVQVFANIPDVSSRHILEAIAAPEPIESMKITSQYYL